MANPWDNDPVVAPQGAPRLVLPAGPPKPAAGYQSRPDGTQAYIPGSGEDPATIGRQTGARESVAAQIQLAKDIAAARAKADIELRQKQAELNLKQQKSPQQKADALFETDELMQTIRDAQAMAREGKGTGYGSLLSSLPASDARLLKSKLQTIKARLTIDALAKAREGSAAGASGFGSLTEKEGDLLAAKVANLDQGLDDSSLLDSLSAVERHYKRFSLGLQGIDPEKVNLDPGSAPAVDGDKKKIIGANALAPDQLSLSDGKTSMNNDPALAGINRRVAGMVASGASADKIKAYLGTAGVDASTVQGIDQAVAFRAKNPGYKGGFSVSIGERNLPMSGTRQWMAGAANSPTGAYFMGAGNALTAGGLDEAVGAFGGNRALADAAKRAIADQYPTANLLGSLSGGAMAAGGLEAGLGATGARGVGMLAPRAMGADALYGAAYGAGENNDDRLGGALTGSITGLGGGVAGRGLVAGAGRAATGVTNAGVNYLKDAGVPMTMGQLVSQSGLPGRVVKGVEDRLSGLPLVGDIVNARRTEGLGAFNKAAFQEGLAPIGAQAAGNIGETGVEDMIDATNGAYRKALGGVSVGIDPQFGNDLGAAIGDVGAIPRVGGELQSTIGATLPPMFDASGRLSGDNLQATLRGIQQLKGGYKNDPLFGSAISPAMGKVKDSVVGMVERQAPDVMPAYNAANAAYKNRKVIGKAVEAAANTDGMFTPAQLGNAARQSARAFGNNADTTARPFFDLQRAGQNILPSKVPDSGTAGRLALPLGLTALGSAGGAGQGYASGDAGSGAATGALSGALISAMLMAPGSKLGQEAIQKLLTGARPKAIADVGQQLRKRAQIGGMFGSPLALQYFATPGN